jgi:hypothetical protein
VGFKVCKFLGSNLSSDECKNLSLDFAVAAIGHVVLAVVELGRPIVTFLSTNPSHKEHLIHPLFIQPDAAPK